MSVSREDAQEWTDALGQSHAGNWRMTLLAHRMGVPDALGLTLEEWQTQWAGGYVRQPIPERQAASLELTAPVAEGGAGLSNRQAAGVLGVDEGTVRNDRRAAESSAPEPEPDAHDEAHRAEDSAPGPEPEPEREPGESDAFDEPGRVTEVQVAFRWLGRVDRFLADEAPKNLPKRQTRPIDPASRARALRTIDRAITRLQNWRNQLEQETSI